MHFTHRYLMAGSLAMLVPTAAGPLRPGQKELSNEVRSLGGLDTFKVAINVESRLLEDTNFPIDALKEKIEAMLTAAGFTLSDEPATPLVHVTLVTQGNEDEDCAARIAGDEGEEGCLKDQGPLLTSEQSQICTLAVPRVGHAQ